jgi:hypothetical protein
MVDGEIAVTCGNVGAGEGLGDGLGDGLGVGLGDGAGLCVGAGVFDVARLPSLPPPHAASKRLTAMLEMSWSTVPRDGARVRGDRYMAGIGESASIARPTRAKTNSNGSRRGAANDSAAMTARIFEFRERSRNPPDSRPRSVDERLVNASQVEGNLFGSNVSRPPSGWRSAREQPSPLVVNLGKPGASRGPARSRDCYSRGWRGFSALEASVRGR